MNVSVIANDMRSCHNVGSLLRTTEGLGIAHVYLCGYSPYPSIPEDTRMPHEVSRIARQIAKTSLGAELTQPWSHEPDAYDVMRRLQASGTQVFALEQSAGSESLPGFKAAGDICLLLGNETEGVPAELIAAADGCLEIPMCGNKESFNVVQAAAMALYHLTYL
jgi:tRNA G18 (ribose-2'-O)-methylase SpoU